MKSTLVALVAPRFAALPRLCSPVFAAAIGILPATATAQAWPDHSVRIIVPYPTGGGTDTLTRLVGRYLGDSLKQPIVVENRAGAMAQIGMDLDQAGAGGRLQPAAIAAGPLNEGNMADFQPISLFAAPSYILVVHPEVKASNVSELVALAKANPGKLAYGSTGGGAASHLATELFKSMADVDMLHVPYKGVGAAVSDLLGGHVQVMLAPPQAVIPHVKAGSLRALGVTGPEPMALLPRSTADLEVRRAGLRSGGLVRADRPRGHPAGGDHPPERRDQPHPGVAGDAGAPEGTGRRAGEDDTGPVRFLHPPGQRQVGEADQGERDRGGRRQVNSAPAWCRRRIEAPAVGGI